MGRELLEQLAGLKAAEWKRLGEEEVLIFATRPREGEVQLPAALEASLRGAQPEIPLPKALFADSEEAIRTEERQMQAKWAEASEIRVILHLNLSLGASPAGILRASPEPARSDGHDSSFMISGLTLFGAPELREPSAEERAAREASLAADPLLGRKAGLKLPPPPKRTEIDAFFGAGTAVRDVLPAIETAYGVKLLGDDYARQAFARFSPPGPEPRPLYQLLDELAGGSRRWEREGEVIRLRSRTWAHDRRAEIPARLLRAWFAPRKEKWRFNLDELAQLAATLRDEQIELLQFVGMEEGSNGPDGDMRSLAESRGILCLYAALDEE